jgi:pyruvate formate lyase activating enzyme
MSKGTIFDIKEFSIYDGDGMRATVFLKGCPLRCKWCHNPEGLSTTPQIMVKTASCKTCGKCHVPNCSLLNNGVCNGCGKCINLCPNNLRYIAGKEYTDTELIDLLNSYEVFFGNDGGITFSGGEPLLQHEFLSNVLDGVKGKSMIETSAYAKSEVFKNIIDKTSKIYMDFKIFDSKKHKFYTGVDNEIIKQNLNILKASNKPFIIRIPLIKGINDDKFNLQNTAKIIKSDNLIRVELLPYNTLAPAKYPMCGKNFEYEFSKPDSILTGVFEDENIEVKVL